jgi:5-methyltetrahydropteroyltriglutamate--homocysteine methyltransferase
MNRSTSRILTTHCGSLPRPAGLLDLMKAKVHGEHYDTDAFAARVRSAVAESVHQQIDCGIDIPTDGEQGKLGFFVYVNERLTGFEPQPGPRPPMFAAEVEAFPEYYKQYFSTAMLGAALAPPVQFACTGPVSYRGHDAIRRDIENLKAALHGMESPDAFLPAVAPSGVGENKYYASYEEYMTAVADALSEEYRAIVDAGFLVQIDDPFLTELYSFSNLSEAERHKTADSHIEALNHALRGIPAERIRYHTCYGINEGPRVHDAPLKNMLGMVLRVKAGAYSNARHEHEYHVFENVKLPEGKLIIPGVITHACNIVEHPELIAERIVRFAKLVGRENVIAGADCGFSSQATYQPEIHPTVIWAKFRAMAEGARLATDQLWA